MRTTVKRWCVSSPTMCVPTTPPSACLQRNFAMALMTAQMARMRNSVVRDNSTQTALQYRENFNSKQNSASLNQGFSCSTALCSYSLCQSSDSLYSTDLCSLDNGDCSHNCTVAPGEGVICSCPLGMELGPDNKTCQIQSFCAKHLKCSQRCEQDKFSAKCSCYEGWELEPDMENCKSTGKGVKWHGGGRKSKDSSEEFKRFDASWTVREEAREATGPWTLSGFKTTESRGAVWVWDQAKERPREQETVVGGDALCHKVILLCTIDRALETEKRKIFNAIHTSVWGGEKAN